MHELAIQWQRFLGLVQQLCPLCSEVPGFNTQSFAGLCDQAIRRLRSDQALGEISQAAQVIEEDNEERAALQLFILEIRLFNDAVEQEVEAGALRVNDAKFRLGQAKTIKESLEKFLSLPRWLQKLLDILNEILGLISP